MATDHETKMFLVSKISKQTQKCLGLLVFRTRKAAREYAKAHETSRVRYYVVPTPVKWGPDN